jgi:hypothetical protein
MFQDCAPALSPDQKKKKKKKEEEEKKSPGPVIGEALSKKRGA